MLTKITEKTILLSESRTKEQENSKTILFFSYMHRTFTNNYPRFERYFRSLSKVLFQRQKDCVSFVFATYSS